MADPRFKRILAAINKSSPAAAERYEAKADIRHAMEKDAAPYVAAAAEIAARIKVATNAVR